MLEELQREIEEKREKRIPNKQFHLVGADQEKYFNDLADTAGIKRLPSVINQIYYYVMNSRNPNDCFEIVDENKFKKL